MAGEGIIFRDAKMKAFFKKLDSNVKDIEKRDKQFWSILTAISFRDVINHFDKQAGPNEPWKKWSTIYADRMEKTGKSGNKILQDSGRLRQSITPADTSSRIKKGQLLFNPAKAKSGYAYAWGHNTGDGKLPQREFMWLSKRAIENMSKAIGEYAVKGIK